METILLSGKNINKTFDNGQNKIHVLNDVSLEIKNGEFLTIMGPSGSGKSTLLYAISGMDQVDSGSIVLAGKSLNELDNQAISDLRRKEMGFIFQHATMLKNLNILDNIMLPAIKDGQELAKVKERALELMDLTGIRPLETRDISQVSGGELQRASICRALINNPKIFFGDEPTGALNSKTTLEIIELLKKINGQGTTVLLVTHDSKVACASERVLFMKDGNIIAEENLIGLSDKDRQERVLEKMKELKI